MHNDNIFFFPLENRCTRSLFLYVFVSILFSSTRWCTSTLANTAADDDVVVLECPAPPQSMLRVNSTTSSSSSSSPKDNDRFLVPTSDTWCALWLISEQGHRIPLARSYGGHDWELYGSVEQQSSRWVLSIDCSFHSNSDNDNNENKVCLLSLPPTQQLQQRYGTFHYTLLQQQQQQQPTSADYDNTHPQKDILAARFLEQATFGVTRADLWKFQNPMAWLQQQFYEVPITSHRAYYRKHLNHRLLHSTTQGIPTHPCGEQTRYRKYAWSDADRQAVLEIESIRGADQKLIRIHGQKRTLIPNVTNFTVFYPDTEQHVSIPDGS